MQIFDTKQIALLSFKAQSIYPQNMYNLSFFEKKLL